MLGEPVGRQDRLFYEFDLEDMVPVDHLLRRIDAVLDLSWLRGEMKSHYSHLGCPSVCPELMIRMLIVGYCYSIRSERRLCQEVKVNLAYCWFCGLGLEDKVPHHSTFSVNRHGRFRESDILRQVFEEVVCGCMTAGLVGGEGFAVDTSVIEANASRFQRVEGSKVDWTDEQRARRPVREYLVALESENPPINPKQKPKRVVEEVVEDLNGALRGTGFALSFDTAAQSDITVIFTSVTMFPNIAWSLGEEYVAGNDGFFWTWGTMTTR